VYYNKNQHDKTFDDFFSEISARAFYLFLKKTRAISQRAGKLKKNPGQKTCEIK